MKNIFIYNTSGQVSGKSEIQEQIHLKHLSQHRIPILDVSNAVDRKDGKRYDWGFNYAATCLKPMFLLTFPNIPRFTDSNMHNSSNINTSDALVSLIDIFLFLSNAQNDGTPNSGCRTDLMKFSNSRLSTGSYSSAHICMDPTPNAFSTSCVQTLGPEIKLVIVTECNVLKTDSRQVESFIIVI